MGAINGILMGVYAVVLRGHKLEFHDNCVLKIKF